MRTHAPVSLTLLVALLMGSTVPLPVRSDGWRKFSPEDGAFEVEFPGPPTAATRKQWQPVGRIVSTVYKVQLPPDTFGLSVTDLPGVTFAFRSRDKIIETTAEGFVEDAKARLTGSGPTQIAGRPAKEVRYEIPADDTHPVLLGVSRMLIVDKRLYIFYAEVSKRTPQAEAKRYFSSIRILEDQD